MILTPNDYDYHLPEACIANSPASPRDHSRLMSINRTQQSIQHHHFYNLPELLNQNDVLVVNQTKVMPARLFGTKSTGGKIEILLLRQLTQNTWEAISRPGLKIGQSFNFIQSQNNPETDQSSISLQAQVSHQNHHTGESTLEFNLTGPELILAINQLGHTPIPPYIHATISEQKLRQQYQTVYAKQPGSAAAPTAGLHFTNKLISKLKAKGVQIEHITLHVGPGTFQRLRPENIHQNKLHLEHYHIGAATANRLNQAKQQGKRIIAVGTTTTRTLESSCTDTPRRVSAMASQLVSGPATTQLFIHPPYQFRFVDAMITNFHLPKSSLLMLVSAFTTQPQTKEKFQTFQNSLIGQAYQVAIENNYRFFSFGDAMFIQ